MKEYLKSSNEVMQELDTSENGLSSAKAADRLAQNGPNKLAEGKKVTLVQRFLKQLADPMVIILIIAAAISGVIAYIEGEAFTDVFIILFVVLLNSVLGVLQESKAEKAIDALKAMTAATSKVIRDGHMITIKSEELVIGDVIVLEAGDAVPADARLIESNSLKCEEAAMTGESVPAEKSVQTLTLQKDQKDISLGDRSNMAYMGSTVVYGRGKAVITGTGMNTEMGKIAGALSEVEEEKTPLQQKLSQLSTTLTKLVLIICVVVFAVSILREGHIELTADYLREVALPTFIVAVSLAVAAIPEGLATVVTIVLSIGVTKMSKRSAVIRRLTAVETLGCTQVICSDKTGTLTQNKMTVVDTVTFDKELLARAMALASDAEMDMQAGHTEAVGEPTECALVNYAYKIGLCKGDLNAAEPRIGEIPFDSSRKMMSTVHRKSDGSLIQYTKGAPDELLRRCTHMLTANGVKALNDAARNDILTANKGMADRALRVLAAAYKDLTVEPAEYSSDAMERDLIFIGLCGMIDPVRPEVVDAIKACSTAGIRPIMITGDHKDTAVAIAKELGIISDASQAITGAELNMISDEELERVIDVYSVYARVQPEHKVRIVKAWKKLGKITAMTGDGVNDAPSIKSADIGIGMGITGTDVTKNVADMILGDDNFATIVYAVEEGRKIYSNIRKAIQFLLSSNLSEVITIFTATCLGFTILEAPHLLWINLITDTFPALALGVEPGEEDIMRQPPRSGKAGIFSGGVGVDLIYQGVMVSMLTLAAFLIGHSMDPNTTVGSLNSENGITMAFLTMSMAEIFHSLNMRSQRSSIFALKKHNLWLYAAMLAAVVLTALVVEVPFLANLFGFTSIDFREYAIAMGLAVLVIPITETVKFIQRLFERRCSH